MQTSRADAEQKKGAQKQAVNYSSGENSGADVCVGELSL